VLADDREPSSVFVLRVRFISSRKELPIRFTLALNQEQILPNPDLTLAPSAASR
jgi:hypothetical protein